MTDQHRKNIARAAKRDSRWSSDIRIQDRIIEELCKKRGYTIHDFYAADGKMLNKLLD